MKSRYALVKEFIEKLKHMESHGQDAYPYWYIYKDEFKDLDDLLDDYQRIYTICHSGMVDRK